MNDVLELSPVSVAEDSIKRAQEALEQTKYYLNLELQINNDVLPEVLLMQVLEFLKDKGVLQSVRINTNRW